MIPQPANKCHASSKQTLHCRLYTFLFSFYPEPVQFSPNLGRYNQSCKHHPPIYVQTLLNFYACYRYHPSRRLFIHLNYIKLRVNILHLFLVNFSILHHFYPLILKHFHRHLSTSFSLVYKSGCRMNQRLEYINCYYPCCLRPVLLYDEILK